MFSFNIRGQSYFFFSNFCILFSGWKEKYLITSKKYFTCFLFRANSAMWDKVLYFMWRYKLFQKYCTQVFTCFLQYPSYHNVFKTAYCSILSGKLQNICLFQSLKLKIKIRQTKSQKILIVTYLPSSLINSLDSSTAVFLFQTWKQNYWQWEKKPTYV